MFVREKRIGRYTYVSLVETARDQGKVRQRIIANLGRNRDRGASHDAAPPTPPGIRVRTTAVRRIKRPPASPWEIIQDL